MYCLHLHLKITLFVELKDSSERLSKYIFCLIYLFSVTALTAQVSSVETVDSLALYELVKLDGSKAYRHKESNHFLSIADYAHLAKDSSLLVDDWHVDTSH